MDIKVGDKFGRLSVTGKAIKRKGRKRFRCLCECGNRRVIRGDGISKWKYKVVWLFEKRSYNTAYYNSWNGKNKGICFMECNDPEVY